MGVPKLKVLPPELAFVVQEVLEYDVPGLEFDSPPRVLDIGANIGAFAVWARERWPGAALTCFEPHPANMAVLRQNTAVETLRFEKVVMGGDTAHRAQLYERGGNLACTTTDPNLFGDAAWKGPIAEVLPALRLPPCDVLKLDVEGAELGILRDYPHLSDCKAVLLEWHRAEDKEPIGEVLRTAGFVLHSSSQSGAVQRWLRKDVAERVPTLEEAAAKCIYPVDHTLGRPHLFLAVLGWRPSAFHVASRMQLAVDCAAVGVDLTIHQEMGAGIDRGRNISVALFRKHTECTHFMFIDADIAFESADVFALIKSGLDVVGGAYPKKGVNWQAVEEAVKRGVPASELAEHANSFVVNVRGGKHVGLLDKATGARFIEVEEIGTGFLMVRREAIERYIAHWAEEIAYVTDYEPKGEIHHLVFQCERDPASRVCQAERRMRMACDLYECERAVDELHAAWKAGPEARGRYLTEDYSFCRRWTMLGGKVYCYLDAKLKHHGQTLFEGHIGHALEQVKS